MSGKKLFKQIDIAIPINKPHSISNNITKTKVIDHSINSIKLVLYNRGKTANCLKALCKATIITPANTDFGKVAIKEIKNFRISNKQGTVKIEAKLLFTPTFAKTKDRDSDPEGKKHWNRDPIKQVNE